MSFNGSGTFVINTSGQPVVTNTVISSTAFNSLTADLATGLSTCITKNGQTAITANIPFGGFKITGLGQPSTLGDSLAYGRDATVATLNGMTFSTSTAVVSIANAKTFSVANTMTLSSTDGANVNLGAGGTVFYAGGSIGAATGTSLALNGATIGSNVLAVKAAGNGYTNGAIAAQGASAGTVYATCVNSGWAWSVDGSTDNMVLNSSGSLLVNTVSNPFSTKAYVLGTANAFAASNTTAISATAVLWNQAASGNNVFLEFGTDAAYATRGTISYNRAGGLTAYNTTCDYRAKDVYGLWNGSGAVIDAIPVHLGRMKGAEMERPLFIAHEVAEGGAPWAVTGEKDALKEDGTAALQQLSESALVAILWAEVQSLRKRLAKAGI